MKKTKIISTIGAIALMLGVGMNLGYSLNDYGINTHSLSAFVWAQNSTAGGGNNTSQTEFGAIEEEQYIDCTTITIIGGSSSSSSGISGGVSGGASMGNWGINGEVSGSSNNSSSNNSTSIVTKERKHVLEVLCRTGYSIILECHPFNPCAL